MAIYVVGLTVHSPVAVKVRFSQAHKGDDSQVEAIEISNTYGLVLKPVIASPNPAARGAIGLDSGQVIEGASKPGFETLNPHRLNCPH